MAAYGSFKAATIADDGNGDAMDGVCRARAQLMPALAAAGGAPDIAIGDAVAAVFSSDDLAAGREPVFQRLAEELGRDLAGESVSAASPQAVATAPVEQHLEPTTKRMRRVRRPASKPDSDVQKSPAAPEPPARAPEPPVKAIEALMELGNLWR